MLTDRCSHGKTWNEPCHECDLVSAKEFVKRWGPQVDEYRKLIEQEEKREEA